MPYGDGTGPVGKGPVTGRGFGFCQGFDHPGNALGPGRGKGRGAGRGFNRGYGQGFGFRAGYSHYVNYGFPEPVEYSPEREKEYLKNRIDSLEKTITSLKKRMNDLDKKK
jgi:hypothetical protein